MQYMQFINGHSDAKLDELQLKKALSYIDGYWPEVTRSQKSDKDTLIKLPHPYVVPTANKEVDFRFDEEYYWDSFFIAVGLNEAKHQSLVEGMLDNLIYLLKRFGMVPTANRMYFTSRTQPPFLTSFIFLVYERYGKSSKWLGEHIEAAKDEYHRVWMYDKHPRWHLVHRGLSRYYDVNMLHDLAEAASGWDMTPRFERKCLDYLPIDLNCLLYKYEMDFARAADILGDPSEANAWRSKAAQRREAVNELMWAKVRGFFFDYNYQKKEKGTVWSLAAYYAMWSGLASHEQAARLVSALSNFEKAGGLVATTRPLIDMTMFGSLKTQWAYPNGWAPLHYLVCGGLERYGYNTEAEKTARKWLKTNLDWFEKKGEFIEKYNMVNPRKMPIAGVYPTQSGFGWTNAIFRYLALKYGPEVSG